MIDEPIRLSCTERYIRTRQAEIKDARHRLVVAGRPWPCGSTQASPGSTKPHAYAKQIALPQHHQPPPCYSIRRLPSAPVCMPGLWCPAQCVPMQCIAYNYNSIGRLTYSLNSLLSSSLAAGNVPKKHFRAPLTPN